MAYPPLALPWYSPNIAQQEAPPAVSEEEEDYDDDIQEDGGNGFDYQAEERAYNVSKENVVPLPGEGIFLYSKEEEEEFEGRNRGRFFFGSSASANLAGTLAGTPTTALTGTLFIVNNRDDVCLFHRKS